MNAKETIITYVKSLIDAALAGIDYKLTRNLTYNYKTMPASKPLIILFDNGLEVAQRDGNYKVYSFNLELILRIAYPEAANPLSENISTITNKIEDLLITAFDNTQGVVDNIRFATEITDCIRDVYDNAVFETITIKVTFLIGG